MASAKKVLVLGGKNGLLGQSICKELTANGWNVYPAGRSDFDPFDQAALADVLEREECDVLINTVAYTMVDKAEEEEEAAYRLNKTLPQCVARTCKKLGVLMVHFSTDFVFNGKKDTPYSPEDEPAPESVYGMSKLAGERALLDLEYEKILIIRTSWLFGPGKMNFVQKILQLATERDELTVVADQIGSPSYTVDLAANTRLLLEHDATGLYHLASSGKASWCELAAEAVEVAGLTCRIKPISASEYPQAAKRPSNSILDLKKFIELTGVTPRPWSQGLRDYIFRDLQITE
ncbi:MAG: dTDP-4-dehydrorhamnose reductase [Desulfovibrio sp.]|uniref:dTDP-4-dehydrorhamnose reductase n=1 Tax=Desulfovibrio sp. 7SRBS1 TaxID=3378064 RepID=UPI003B3CDA9D